MGLKIAMDNYFKIIGLVITITGWLVANSDRVEIIQTIIAPEYTDAQFALNTLKNHGNAINPGDRGFTQVVNLAKSHIVDSFRTTVGSIRTEDNIYSNDHPSFGYFMLVYSNYVMDYLTSQVSQISVSKSYSGLEHTAIGEQHVPAHDLRLEYERIPPLTITVTRMADKMTLSLYDHRRFRVSATLFWTGIVISIIGIVMGKNKVGLPQHVPPVQPRSGSH